MSATVLSVMTSGDENKIAISWFAGSSQNKPNSSPDSLVVPPFPYISNSIGPGSIAWGKFILDPQSVQSSSQFGIGRSLMLSIQRTSAYFVDSTHYNIPGRVAVRVSATGQILMLGDKQPLLLTAEPTAQQIWLDTLNSHIPIWTKNNAPIELYLEPDYKDGATANIRTCVIATIFSYDIGIMSTI